jgi:hypothetical protein
MERHRLEYATTWAQSVLDSTVQNFPTVSFRWRQGRVGVYDLIVEGSQTVRKYVLGEAALEAIADRICQILPIGGR